MSAGKRAQLRVIYEDNHLLCVEKPPGVLVQGDQTGDTSLLQLAKLYLKEKYQKPGEAYLGLVHRLDRPTGGVLLFCRTSKAAARISAQFRDRKVKKTYLAVCWGKARAGRVSLHHHLVVDRERRKTTVYDKPCSGSKEARLTYQMMSAGSGTCLLQVVLETGRKHQIRAQLSHVGLPIVGDRKYASVPGQGGFVESIGLWAHRLEIEHPVRGEALTLVSHPDWQNGAPWSQFRHPM